MARSDIVSFGSHTLSHPILTRIPSEQARVEIEKSKQVLEAEIQEPIDTFAYPNGTVYDFNAEILYITRTTGYKAACTTIPGTNRQGANVYTLQRVTVAPDVYKDFRGRFSADLFATRVSAMLDGVLFRS